MMDVDARIQLFDLKTKYQFMTTPGVDQYNMPLYSVQTEPTGSGQTVGIFPVYQGFEGPAFANGIQMPFHTQRDPFFNIWPSYVQQLPQTATGNGSAGPYTLQLPFLPNSASAINPVTSGIIRGHVDITGIIATGVNQDPPITPTFITTIPTTSVYSAVYFTATAADGTNIVVADSGQFLTGNTNYGLLMSPGAAPYGNTSLGPYSTTSNTVNYQTGLATVTFPNAIPSGNPIGSSCIFYELGIPRAVLYYNNIITLRAPPNTQYLVELDAYLSPAAFLNTSQAIPFGYMAEYLARGAARKILADTGDVEQFQFYEPLFREQEILVWKRSQRQFTSTRTQTIFSGQGFQGQTGSSGQGLA
jgi:hypothetical protein